MLMLRIAPVCSAAVPLTEKMHMLHSDTGYSAVGCRLSINEPTMVYIKKKKKEIAHLHVKQLCKVLR